MSGEPTVYDGVDVAVVGAGAAGLYAALVAAEAGATVRLVSRSPLAQSASFRAQGGLAAALGDDDTPDLHLEDTINAGRGATRTAAARILCEEAPQRVRELEQRGVRFDTENGDRLALGLEGGHRRRRIAHAQGSATGRQVTRVLSALAVEYESIRVHERTSALGLLTDAGRCTGLASDAGVMPAAATVLATGGAAALWRRTTNPRGAVGTGLWLAHEAGAVLGDLELLQFHPTALVAGDTADGFLVTEAIRGEGARLLDHDGRRFVDELAPRDEVSRAIIDVLDRNGRDAVSLDMREVNPDRFPNVTEALGQAGLDPRRDLIPVAPAAHYMIGGIVTDSEGRSTLPGLYAVGECADAGVHGANRLASNSLSECFVFGRRAALAAVAEGVPPGGSPQAVAVTPPPVPGDATRAALWEHAGLIREAGGLTRLADDPHPLARLVALSALARQESRGCQMREDFPDPDPGLDRGHVVIDPGAEQTRLERWG